MSITNELRKWAIHNFYYKERLNEFLDIADRIDAEHEAMLADARKTVYQGLIELPKDADGEYIRVGDVMNKGKVTCIRDCGKGWEVVLDNMYMYDAPSLRHYHAPTVEDVLREFFARYVTTKPKDEDDAIIAEYAAKLRLAGEDA